MGVGQPTQRDRALYPRLQLHLQLLWGAVTVVPDSTGDYSVLFSGLSITAADDVQVTAYNTTGYCMDESWAKTGTNTIQARVACFTAAGVPANSYFTLLYVARSGNIGNANVGLAFLYDDNPDSLNYTPTNQYNSSGLTSSIMRSSAGSYTVTVPGLTKLGRHVQVTAVGDGAARCKTGGWSAGPSGTTINVLCFDAAGRRPTKITVSSMPFMSRSDFTPRRRLEPGLGRTTPPHLAILRPQPFNITAFAPAFSRRRAAALGPTA